MKKITTKIVLAAFSISFVIALVLTLILVSSLKSTNEANLAMLEENLRADFDVKSKNQVQTVKSLVNAVYNLPEDSLFGNAEKEKLAADLVRELRYGTEGYFWIDTKDGDNVVLLGKDTEGKNRYDLQDSNGKYLIRLC